MPSLWSGGGSRLADFRTRFAGCSDLLELLKCGSDSSAVSDVSGYDSSSDASKAEPNSGRPDKSSLSGMAERSCLIDLTETRDFV